MTHRYAEAEFGRLTEPVQTAQNCFFSAFNASAAGWVL
jgi:hypothetical protein